MKILRIMYGKDKKVHLVQKALGESEGEGEITISNDIMIASLSEEWIQAVKKSGRCPEENYSWEKKQAIQITTLDQLISQYGIPAFIKIDVEGYEYQVLQGLHQPVRALSLEFTPELLEPTFQCLDHLSSLGEIRINYSLSESMKMELTDWVTPQEMKELLSQSEIKLMGDLYVRF